MRRIRVRWRWAVRLHINGAKIPGAGRSVQNWQEIVIWPNWGNFQMRCSNLAITLVTSIRFAHMTPIRKLSLTRTPWPPSYARCTSFRDLKFAVFLFKTLILDIFLPFIVMFRLLFRRWFWARFGLDFRQTTYFILYFVLLGFSRFCYFL
jgi:hypothetical protein